MRTQVRNRQISHDTNKGNQDKGKAHTKYLIAAQK